MNSTSKCYSLQVNIHVLHHPEHLDLGDDLLVLASSGMSHLHHGSYTDAIADPDREANTIIHDSLSDTTVAFANPSDTLIASLRLEQRLSVPVINLFIRILRDPRFRGDELSFGDAADVDWYVAQQRREARDEWSSRCAGAGGVMAASSSSNIETGCKASNASASLLPYPILLGILDALATDATLYDEPINFQVPRPDVGSLRRDDVFRTLTLVHRTWTIPCQQHLARRVVVRSAAALVRLLRSPVVVRGATAELVVSLGALWNRGFYFLEEAVSSGDAMTCGDVEFNVVNLMKRMPRLEKLHMLESGLHEGIILSQISQTQTLRSLTWLRAHGYPNCDFALLCTTLNRLPNLRELEISGWTFRTSLGQPFMDSPPTFVLCSLSVVISPGERLVGQVGWLVQALEKSGRAKLRLDVTLVARFSTKEILRVFPLCESALAGLGSLHVVNKGGFEETNLDEMRAFVRNCTNVKKLHLQSKNVSILEFLDVIPSSVEELRYSWFDMWAMPWSIVESHMPRLISSEELPKLRQVTINNYEVPFYHLPPRSLEVEGQHPAPKTQAACDGRGIVLELTSQLDWRDM